VLAFAGAVRTRQKTLCMYLHHNNNKIELMKELAVEESTQRTIQGADDEGRGDESVPQIQYFDFHAATAIHCVL
jgi:hypothetical protein